MKTKMPTLFPGLFIITAAVLITVCANLSLIVSADETAYKRTDSAAQYSAQNYFLSSESIGMAERKVLSQNNFDSSAKKKAVSIPLGERYYAKTPGAGKNKSWYAFTTSEKKDRMYDVTVVNKTDPSLNRAFDAEIYDGDGNILNDMSREIKPTGVAHTNSLKLNPDSTYYILINNINAAEDSDEIEYMLLIRDPSDPDHSNLLGTGARADAESDMVRGGTSQDDAILFPLDSAVYGTCLDTGNTWYAFTTGSEECVYNITIIQKTAVRKGLCIWVYDGYGKCLNKDNRIVNDESYALGVAHTESLKLSAQTNYYIRIESNAGLDFMLRVKDPAASSDGHQTTGSISQAKGTSDVLDGTAIAGSNQDDALRIPLNTEYTGKTIAQIGSFLSFTTADQDGCTYKIKAVHGTPGTEDIVLRLYDEYGKTVNKRHGDVQSDGTVYERELDLRKNTTYYIVLWDPDKVDYSLTVEADGLKEVEEEPLVFEEPFELNETLVHFVANEAVFVDEKAVKAALKPVAKIILAHPDHPILLAGTTATWGSQKTSVDLSLRRANAVKDFLVTQFGVPDKQLLTIGLGFEDDPFVRGQDIDSNGMFVETEAAKNRRVIVMDAEDPIAKELLDE